MAAHGFYIINGLKTFTMNVWQQMCAFASLKAALIFIKTAKRIICLTSVCKAVWLINRACNMPTIAIGMNRIGLKIAENAVHV